MTGTPQFIFIGTLYSLIKIFIYFLLAWLVYRSSWRIAGLLLQFYNFGLPSHLSARLTGQVSKRLIDSPPAEPPVNLTPRRQTLHQLIANAVALLAFIIAGLASMAELVEADTIIWVAGLVGSALAFAGRTQIGDFLAGIGIIFEDRFTVGEKVLVKAQLERLEGVIEHVSLSSTWLRAPTGELFVIPNGEMRFVCNYSRGLHSSANVTIKIPATHLNQALPLLKNLGQEAVGLLPGLSEPWRVISETGAMGQQVELTLVVKTNFAQGADLRPHLLALVQKRLTLADIPLTG
jgi:small-conductance mechanosensitive channel